MLIAGCQEWKNVRITMKREEEGEDGWMYEMRWDERTRNGKKKWKRLNILLATVTIWIYLYTHVWKRLKKYISIYVNLVSKHPEHSAATEEGRLI